MEIRDRRAIADSPKASDAVDELSFSASPASGGAIVPVILSGGSGSRLWPFSTHETPKQFLPLLGAKSLFREALDRVRDRLRFAAPIVVGSIHHLEQFEAELLPEGDSARLLLEPCARNTAPAIAMAAAVAREIHGSDALLLVMPSDHVIEDVAALHEAVSKGEQAAQAGRLVTFGVRPTNPDTGYGYIRMGDELAGAPGVLNVLRFVEKPPAEVAERIAADGEHLWNAGIFLFQAGAFLEEVNRLAPAIGHAALQAVDNGERDGIRITADSAALSTCPGQSIDYAVMEHSSRVVVVPMSVGWSDVGTWDALAAKLGHEVVSGPITALDCESCFIRSDGIEVAALGVRDLIIVASGQRLLVLPRGQSQEVEKLLSAMKSKAA